MADYDIKSVAQYLEAEALITRFFRSPYVPSRTAVRRIGSVFATLEVILETSLFEFKYDVPPIDRELVRLFIRKNQAAAKYSFSDTAWRFLLRYTSVDVSAIEDELHSMSFGRTSGVIELCEHLLCNDAIITMLNIWEMKMRQRLAYAPLLTFNAIGALARREDPNQGVVAFRRFARNLFHFTKISDGDRAPTSIDAQTYDAVLECIRPLLARRKIYKLIFEDDDFADGSADIRSFWIGMENSLQSDRPFSGSYAETVISWSSYETRIVG